MSSKDSVQGTMLIAFLLCVACSVVISSAAVMLQPLQAQNKLLDRNKNVLIAAGIFDPEINTNDEVPRLFSEFTPRIVDLEAGRFLSEQELTDLGIDPETYDQRIAANDPRLSKPLSNSEDIASIQRRVNYATVYIIEDESGGIDTIVLPISGYGLWGTMHAFLALQGDTNTVIGIGFYDQQETPGLGGEVTNPRWRSLWEDKKIYDEQGNVALSVIKGQGTGPHQIDGLSGASLTSRGVDNLLEYWLGESGFGPLLAAIRNS